MQVRAAREGVGTVDERSSSSSEVSESELRSGKSEGIVAAHGVAGNETRCCTPVTGPGFGCTPMRGAAGGSIGTRGVVGIIVGIMDDV